jgi:hypothetical protein
MAVIFPEITIITPKIWENDAPDSTRVSVTSAPSLLSPN